MNGAASNQTDMATNHIATVAEYENNIEHLKTNIQYGGLLQLNRYNLLNMMSIIIEHKDVSAVHRRMYDEFLNFLEIYDAQYTDKHRDLIQYILDGMTDEARNRLPIDNNGNPMDEAGRIRDVQRQRYTNLQQIWQQLKKYFFSKAILIERIAEIIKGNKNLQQRLIDSFNLDLKNALEARINNFNAGSMTNPNALRRKVFESFLELQRISQRKLSGEVLGKIEQNAIDSYLADIPINDVDLRSQRRAEITGFFKELREGDDGLEQLFKLMDEDVKVENPLDASAKTLGEFWGLANWPGWNKDAAWYKNLLTQIAYPIKQVSFRLLRNFLNHSPWKNIEFQRILLRGNYSTGSVIVRQMFSLFLNNVLLPMIKGYCIFLFYAD